MPLPTITISAAFAGVSPQHRHCGALKQLAGDLDAGLSLARDRLGVGQHALRAEGDGIARTRVGELRDLVR
jgi:hypothetical protein